MQPVLAANGLTIGILPTDTPMPSLKQLILPSLLIWGTLAIILILQRCCHCCGMGAGTASEIVLAPKGNKKVILLNDNEESRCFSKLSPQNVYVVDSPSKAIKLLKLFSNIMLNNNSPAASKFIHTMDLSPHQNHQVFYIYSNTLTIKKNLPSRRNIFYKNLNINKSLKYSSKQISMTIIYRIITLIYEYKVKIFQYLTSNRELGRVKIVEHLVTTAQH